MRRSSGFAIWWTRQLIAGLSPAVELLKGILKMKAIVTILFTMLIIGFATPVYDFGAASAQAKQKSPQKKEQEPSPKPKDPTGSLRIPDATVYDQNGNKLKFYTDLVKGKTVAINFIFTTCTAICPALTATFRRVQQQLGERVGQDVHLISVSVDPTTDVPERLKEYAAKFKAGPGWTFVTGDKVEIDSVLLALGTAVANKNDHTPMVLIGNEAAGNWSRAYGLSPPTRLVDLIKAAASKSVATSTKLERECISLRPHRDLRAYQHCRLRIDYWLPSLRSNWQLASGNRQ